MTVCAQEHLCHCGQGILVCPEVDFICPFRNGDDTQCCPRCEDACAADYVAEVWV